MAQKRDYYEVLGVDKNATADDLKKNLAENCVPEEFMEMDIFDYAVFLDTRRTMMAQYIRKYYESLG